MTWKRVLMLGFLAAAAVSAVLPLAIARWDLAFEAWLHPFPPLEALLRPEAAFRREDGALLVAGLGLAIGAAVWAMRQMERSMLPLDAEPAAEDARARAERRAADRAIGVAFALGLAAFAGGYFLAPDAAVAFFGLAAIAGIGGGCRGAMRRRARRVWHRNRSGR